MNNIIKFKNGTGTPPTLAIGELGIALDDGKLIIGTASGNKVIFGDAMLFSDVHDYYCANTRKGSVTPVFDGTDEYTRLAPLQGGKLPAALIPGGVDNIIEIHRFFDLAGEPFKLGSDIRKPGSGAFQDNAGNTIVASGAYYYYLVQSNVWNIWRIRNDQGDSPEFVRELTYEDTVYFCGADGKMYRFSGDDSYPDCLDEPPEDLDGGTW